MDDWFRSAHTNCGLCACALLRTTGIPVVASAAEHTLGTAGGGLGGGGEGGGEGGGGLGGGGEGGGAGDGGGAGGKGGGNGAHAQTFRNSAWSPSWPALLKNTLVVVVPAGPQMDCTVVVMSWRVQLLP